MTFWKKFADLLIQESNKYQVVSLSQNRVDVGGEVSPITSGNSYCRVWLVEMKLAENMDWVRFIKRYPIYHSATRFIYGDEVVTIPYVAGLKHFTESAEEVIGRVIRCNIPLTPLFPFNKGTIELQAGLFSMIAASTVEKFGAVVGHFSQLLLVPELSKVVNIVGPTYSSIADLFSISDTTLELGSHLVLTANRADGSNVLYPGYFATIEDKNVDSEALCIVNDSLQVGVRGRAKEFMTHARRALKGSYMLFRLEARNEQDWNSLTLINSLVQNALETAIRGNIEQVKRYLLPSIISTVYQSNDITESDRRRMARAILSEFQETMIMLQEGALSLEEAKSQTGPQEVKLKVSNERPSLEEAKSQTGPQEVKLKVSNERSLASIMKQAFLVSSKTMAELVSIERLFVK